MSASSIEWTDEVWNPVTGCDRVSPGCAHCYALELAPRLRAMHQARGGGKWANVPDGTRASSGPAFGVTLHPDVLEQPFRWRRPRRVFVNSMSDLFHEDIPDQFIHDVFNVMHRARQHTFQVLTKRPERMRDFFLRHRDTSIVGIQRWDEAMPLPNVWLGVSIENRRYVHRADVLRETLAAVRFISAEPLLGPLVRATGGCTFAPDAAGECTRCWRRWGQHAANSCYLDDEAWAPRPDELDLHGIDWLIVGGESGSRHRPMREEWVRDLRDACLANPLGGYLTGPEGRTAFFFKQWGGRTPKAGGRELDGRTWDEMPAAAAVRA